MGWRLCQVALITEHSQKNEKRGGHYLAPVESPIRHIWKGSTVTYGLPVPTSTNVELD
jgi:hypothetical protein